MVMTVCLECHNTVTFMGKTYDSHTVDAVKPTIHRQILTCTTILDLGRTPRSRARARCGGGSMQRRLWLEPPQCRCRGLSSRTIDEPFEALYSRALCWDELYGCGVAHRLDRVAIRVYVRSRARWQMWSCLRGQWWESRCLPRIGASLSPPTAPEMLRSGTAVLDRRGHASTTDRFPGPASPPLALSTRTPAGPKATCTKYPVASPA